ncbi:CoA transferase, partial [Enterococcus faecium]
MERLGYSWDKLHARFPNLIYASTTGFGHSGPDSSKGAYDLVIQGRSGLMSMTGRVGDPPTRVGVSIADLTAGMFLA